MKILEEVNPIDRVECRRHVDWTRNIIAEGVEMEDEAWDFRYVGAAVGQNLVSEEIY